MSGTPHEERKKERCQWMEAVANRVSVGDKLAVETRTKTRSLELVEPVQIREGDKYRRDATVLHMEGYGTSYRLEIPTDRSRFPGLFYPSGTATGVIVRDLSIKGEEELAIVSDKTAADFGIPEL